MAEHKNPGVEDVITEAGKYIHNPDSIALIRHAANFAMERHAGQFRKSGEPYFIHLVNVAYILAGLQAGPKTIAAGFLHDTIEDTGITKEELAAEFDDEIAELVEAVTKIGTLKFKGKDDPEYQASNHRKIFIAMAKDIRVILIKLADRLHNMRTLQYQSEAAQKRIAAETLDVYAPIAHRLGISSIKNELEDLCFFYLNREEYYHIAALVDNKKTERDAAVSHMIDEISAMLKENGLQFRIFGRSKHLYSIYNKMVKKNKRFDEILDLLAIRIVTDTELHCYEILGYIHAKYKPIPGRLKDYIAVPKTNMYQSLHTTIIGDDGKIFEVQIRTEEMDQVAERGVAAHWRYKEGSRYDPKKEQQEIEDKLSWFKNFAVYSEEASASANASEYMATLQHDVFEANVYVMTPKGRVIDLPNGATPIDFAYRIHTEVGNHAVGAIVNNVMVPIDTKLKTGDICEIKTNNAAKPSEDWLKFVRTASARNKIRAWIAKSDAENSKEFIEEGRRILREEIRNRGLDEKTYLDPETYRSYLGSFGARNFDEILTSIGKRQATAGTLLEKVAPQKRSFLDNLSKMLKKNQNYASNNKKHQKSIGISVKNVSGLKMQLSKCCSPIPGDPIVGFVSKGQGIKVHRADCPNVANIDKGRLIDVYWDYTNLENKRYNVDLELNGLDRPNLLNDVVTCLGSCNVNILNINAGIHDLDAIIKLTLSVDNAETLQQCIDNLNKIQGIATIKRVIH